MTHYVVTERHWPRMPHLNRSGAWPRLTVLCWTIDIMPDAIFFRLLGVIDHLRGRK